MHLKVSITDHKIEKMTDEVSLPREYIVVWVYFTPYIKIILSHPGVGYVGEAMTAKLQPNGNIIFGCNTKPLLLQDTKFQRVWPSGAWHFLQTLNAVEEWLAIETNGGYMPMLQKMIFRLIDNL